MTAASTRGQLEIVQKLVKLIPPPTTVEESIEVGHFMPEFTKALKTPSKCWTGQLPALIEVTLKRLCSFGIISADQMRSLRCVLKFKEED